MEREKGERSDQQDRLESPDTQSWYRGRRLPRLGAEEEEEGAGGGGGGEEEEHDNDTKIHLIFSH